MSLSDKLICREEFEIRGAAWKKKPAQLPGRNLDKLSHLETLQPVELSAGFASFFRFPASVSCHTCLVSFGDAAIFESFLTLHITPVKLTASPSWTLMVSILWSVMGL